MSITCYMYLICNAKKLDCALSQKNGEKPESMTSKDAAMFPIIASCTLLGLYIFFKVSWLVQITDSW